MEELQEFKLSVSVNQCHLSKLRSIKSASACCVHPSQKVVGLNWELSLWVPNTSTLGQIGDSKLATGVNVSVVVCYSVVALQ